MIRLVLTDLDDTLIPREDEGVASGRTMQAVRAVLDAGVRFGPVSGRIPASMAAAFHGEERAWATGAFANGQLVCLDGRIIHREWCAADPLQRVADILDDLREGVLVLFDMDAGGAWFVSREPDRVRAGADFGALITSVRERVEGPMLKANIHMDVGRERMVEVRDLLRREVPELDFVFPSVHAPLIDILPAGFGKGDAARILAVEMGITLDDLCVFGDSENDLSLLAATPNSVAVANASPEAAAVARWHIGASADGAVADALLDIADAAGKGCLPSFMEAETT